MKRQHTYEKLIGQKLNGLAAPDVTGLWDQMESILDSAMPQQEKKKRRGAWWLNPNMLMAASLALVIGGVYSFNSLTETAPLAQPGTNTSLADTGANAPIAASDKGANSETATETATGKNHRRGAVTKAISSAAIAAATHSGESLQHKTAVDYATAQQMAVAKTITANRNASINEHATTAKIKTTLFEETTTLNSANTTAISENEEAANTASTSTANKGALPVVEIDIPTLAAPASFNLQNATPLTLADLKRKLNLKKRSPIYVDKGVSFGVALNYLLPVNGQKKNDLDMKGGKNKLQDYIPSVYGQLHLNKKVYVQAEWQPVAPQYTPNYTLYHNIDEPSPDEKEEKIITLNKLYYTSLPLSVHYKTPLKNVSVGVGMQLSLLKKMILQDQEYYQVIGPGRWDTIERKNEVAVKNPDAVRDHNSGDVADNVAKAFRKTDWRLLADVGYQYKGLSAGLRYTRGLHYFYNSNFTNLPVKARNESLQVYVRFNLFDSRKK